jgi:hypothetical protein
VDEQRWLTFDLFDGRVGESFEVSTDGVPAVTMELTEATESTEPGGPGPDGEERRQFSLVFRGPAGPMLPQAIYRLDHAELGELELFLVPIGPDAEGMRYEAAFA